VNALAAAVADHLVWLATHGYAQSTVRTRRYELGYFCAFAEERDVTEVGGVTPSLLDSYQRHLFHLKKRNGQPLTFKTQSHRLAPLRTFGAWLATTGLLPYDPAATLVLPKTERRLPEVTLSADEVEAVLAGPDTTTPAGLRDRAVLEVFYSTAMRRAELIGLQVTDVDFSRGTAFIRQGKGGTDRHVPMGGRAQGWVLRYLDEARPHFATVPDPGTLFLNSVGKPLGAELLSTRVARYVRAAAPTKKGSCHLFRHTCATLMLEGGADVRYVAELLGHRNLETTMLYTRVSLAKLREVHARCHPAEHHGALDPTGQP
jgi:integrase/recombinase XerD